MKKRILLPSITAAFLLSVFLPFTSKAQDSPVIITILHTNDMHASYLPSVATWLDDRPQIGGFVALDYYARREKALAKNSLLLDAGDLMTGTLICDMQRDGVYGGALIEMMNKIGYDGWVFGNHEFDKGAENVRGLIELAKFPVFCANLVKGDTLFVRDAYHIYEKDGLRIGVIGITYHRMVGMAPPEKLDGFVSVDPAPVVSKIVVEIDPKTDLIIVLSHLGIESDRELAKSITGVDMIIGGHSHTRLETPERVNGILIVQTGSNCRNLGRVDLTVAGDSIMSYSGRLIPMLTEDVTPNPALASLVDSIKSEIDKEYGVVIAHLKDNWETQYRAESNIGDWITDAVKRHMKSDVAFLNSGGIRKNLDAGPVTKIDIYEILPFDNKMVTFTLTGLELMKIAEHNVGLEADSYQGSLQVSGLSYSWKGENDRPEITDVLVNGAPIKPDKIYRVATIDYVAVANAERYFGFRVENVRETDIGLTQLVLEEVEKAGEITSKIDGRAKHLE